MSILYYFLSFVVLAFADDLAQLEELHKEYQTKSQEAVAYISTFETVCAENVKSNIENYANPYEVREYEDAKKFGNYRSALVLLPFWIEDFEYKQSEAAQCVDENDDLAT